MCCFDGTCNRCSDRAIALLRSKLTGYSEGYGKVTFSRIDGRTVVVDNVHIDSIGVDAGTVGLGVVSLTQEDETIRHIPFVESWTVDY